MATHTKLDIHGALKIAARTFARMDVNCRHNKNDYFGTGDDVQKT